MGKRVAEYIHTDDEGEEYRIRYTTNTCRCSCDCYADKLEVEDYPGAGEFFEMEIECPEIKMFLTELIEKGCKKV